MSQSDLCFGVFFSFSFLNVCVVIDGSRKSSSRLRQQMQRNSHCHHENGYLLFSVWNLYHPTSLQHVLPALAGVLFPVATYDLVPWRHFFNCVIHIFFLLSFLLFPLLVLNVQKKHMELYRDILCLRRKSLGISEQEKKNPEPQQAINRGSEYICRVKLLYLIL